MGALAKRSRPGRLVWVGALLGLWATGVAEAHPGQLRRTLMLEPAGEVLEVLLEVVVTGADRQRALLALADVDRDGRISEQESERIGLELASFGLDGLTLRVGTGTVALAHVETKTQADPGGPIVVLVHGQVFLGQAEGITVETGRAAVGGDRRTAVPGAAPLLLRLVPGRPSLSSVRGQLDRKGLREIPLSPQDRVELRLGPRR